MLGAEGGGPCRAGPAHPQNAVCVLLNFSVCCLVHSPTLHICAFYYRGRAAQFSAPALHNLCRLIYSPLARPDAPGCPNVAQIINVAQFINGSFNLSMLLYLSMLQVISMAWGRQGLPKAPHGGPPRAPHGPPGAVAR